MSTDNAYLHDERALLPPYDGQIFPQELCAPMVNERLAITSCPDKMNKKAIVHPTVWQAV